MPPRWARGHKKADGTRPEPAAPAPTQNLQVRTRRIPLSEQDCECTLVENWFTLEECEHYMGVLKNDINWQRQEVTLSHIPRENQTVIEPRMTQFMSDAGIFYAYSGRDNAGVGWNEEIRKIKEKAERAITEVCGGKAVVFNSAQMNRYNHPRHTLGLHKDNEADLLRGAPIASVSFGTPRDFVLQHSEDKSEVYNINLDDGSFLLMAGAMQVKYLHGVPVGAGGLRFNITFRICIPRVDPSAGPAVLPGRRSDDWKCPNCPAFGFAARMTCQNCGAVKPGADLAGKASGRASQIEERPHYPPVNATTGYSMSSSHHPHVGGSSSSRSSASKERPEEDRVDDGWDSEPDAATGPSVEAAPADSPHKATNSRNGVQLITRHLESEQRSAPRNSPAAAAGAAIPQQLLGPSSKVVAAAADHDESWSSRHASGEATKMQNRNGHSGWGATAAQLERSRQAGSVEEEEDLCEGQYYTDTVELRVDPHTGRSLTFEQLRAHYKGKYSPEELRNYWEYECKVKFRGKGGNGYSNGRGVVDPSWSSSSQQPRRRPENYGDEWWGSNGNDGDADWSHSAREASHGWGENIERRRDPLDHRTYTWEEFRIKYRRKYGEAGTWAYWCDECIQMG